MVRRAGDRHDSNPRHRFVFRSIARVSTFPSVDAIDVILGFPAMTANVTTSRVTA